MDNPAFPYDPANAQSVLKEIWKRLESAPSTREHPWRLLTLGTWDGEAPQIRTLVLRQVSAENRLLTLYSDMRGQKIWQINEHPLVGVLFYDPQTQVQLRVTGNAVVLDDKKQIDAVWNKLPAPARKMYLAPQVPGKLISQSVPNLPPELIHREPTLEESKKGRANFSVIQIEVTKIDWLYLKKDGHIRAKFQWENQEWKTSYVAT